MSKSPMLMIAGLVVAGLAGTSAALAHDAIALRLLVQEKQVEALSTTSVSLGGDLKPMQVAVTSSNGRMRNVAVVLMDMRAAYRPAFLSRFSQAELYGSPEEKDLIRAHPVVRISGTVDCTTGRAMWNALDHSDTTVAPASVTRALKNPGDNGNLPKHLSEAARASVCATRPADA